MQALTGGGAVLAVPKSSASDLATRQTERKYSRARGFTGLLCRVMICVGEVGRQMRRHSAVEIASMVHQAEELMARGRSQADACKTLGVSVMTFHRWRKQEAARNSRTAEVVEARVVGSASSNQNSVDGKSDPRSLEESRIDELRLENNRLRRIVTDLLLEKMRIEEQLALHNRMDPARRGAQS